MCTKDKLFSEIILIYYILKIKIKMLIISNKKSNQITQPPLHINQIAYHFQITHYLTFFSIAQEMVQSTVHFHQIF